MLELEMGVSRVHGKVPSISLTTISISAQRFDTVAKKYAIESNSRRWLG
jgi:hypothetical protein